MLKFRQLPAHPALNNLLRGYWLIEADGTEEVLNLVPDGYPEIFFRLNDTISTSVEKGVWSALPEAGVVGQLTTPFAMKVAAFSKVVYVKLYPWALATFFPIPAWELNNLLPDLSSVKDCDDFRALSSRIRSIGNFDEMKPLLDDFFLKKMVDIPAKNHFLQFAVHQIFESSGMVNLADITARTRASRRYVEKLFKNQIGLPPKQYARLIRVKKASMHLLDANFTGSIGTIASSLGYFDQSHFLKDFKSVVGQTPTAFMQGQANFPLDRIEAYLGQWDYS